MMNVYNAKDRIYVISKNGHPYCVVKNTQELVDILDIICERYPYEKVQAEYLPFITKEEVRK